MMFPTGKGKLEIKLRKKRIHSFLAKLNSVLILNIDSKFYKKTIDLKWIKQIKKKEEKASAVPKQISFLENSVFWEERLEEAIETMRIRYAELIKECWSKEPIRWNRMLLSLKLQAGHGKID